MAARRIDRKTYDALVKAFQDAPGKYNAAGRAAKCSFTMAKRAWLEGWPDVFLWAKPIKDLIEAEQTAARASPTLRARDAVIVASSDVPAAIQSERDRKALVVATVEADAAVEAVRTRAEEAEGVRRSRIGAAETLGAVNELMPGVKVLASQLGAFAGCPDRKIETMETATAAADLLGKVASIGRIATETLKRAQEMDRKLLGSPERDAGKAKLAEMSLTDLRKELLERLRFDEDVQAGRIVVVDERTEG